MWVLYTELISVPTTGSHYRCEARLLGSLLKLLHSKDMRPNITMPVEIDENLTVFTLVARRGPFESCRDIQPLPSDWMCTCGTRNTPRIFCGRHKCGRIQQRGPGCGTCREFGQMRWELVFSLNENLPSSKPDTMQAHLENQATKCGLSKWTPGLLDEC